MGIFTKLFSRTCPRPVYSAELMPEDQFWKLIEAAYTQAGGNYRVQQEELAKLLRTLSPLTILTFDNRFRQLCGKAFNWNLWGAAYTVHGGCYEEHFYQFRHWMVAQGKEVYYTVLNHPDSLANLDAEKVNIDWEGMQNIADKVYVELTGEHLSSLFVENQTLTGEEWQEFSTDLKERFPNLWLKYNPPKN